MVKKQQAKMATTKVYTRLQGLNILDRNHYVAHKPMPSKRGLTSRLKQATKLTSMSCTINEAHHNRLQSRRKVNRLAQKKCSVPFTGEHRSANALFESSLKQEGRLPDPIESIPTYLTQEKAQRERMYVSIINIQKNRGGHIGIMFWKLIGTLPP